MVDAWEATARKGGRIFREKTSKITKGGSCEARRVAAVSSSVSWTLPEVQW